MNHVHSESQDIGIFCNCKENMLDKLKVNMILATMQNAGN